MRCVCGWEATLTSATGTVWCADCWAAAAGGPQVLRLWLTGLKRQGRQITLGRNGQLELPGADHHDVRQLARHNHALRVAIDGTHPVWWRHVSGQSLHAPTDVDEIPHAEDGFACACCGAPAAHLDVQLLPWCERHQIASKPPDGQAYPDVWGQTAKAGTSLLEAPQRKVDA